MFLYNRFTSWKRLKKQAGQSLTEYAVVLGIIVLVGVVVSLGADKEKFGWRLEIRSLYSVVTNSISGPAGDSLDKELEKNGTFGK